MQTNPEPKTPNTEPRTPFHLLTPKGFDQEFFKLLGQPGIKTQVQAYEVLESIYKHHFKKTRYSNFDSYRVARDNRLKNKR